MNNELVPKFALRYLNINTLLCVISKNLFITMIILIFKNN